jgi:hypothetical protein
MKEERMTESKQPTPAEVEEFWERCDLYAEERSAWSGKIFYSWFAPNKLFICDDAPPIDLNNLFRYAVPKLKRYNVWSNVALEDNHIIMGDHEATVFLPDDTYGHGQSDNPALALFWAIRSVFHA